MRVFLELKWYFIERKKQYGLGIFMLVFVAFLQLVPPKIVGILVDEVRANTLTMESLWKWLLILLVSGLFMYIFRYFWRQMIFGSSIFLARKLRARLFHHFTKMSPQFYQRKRIGDLMAHATNDIQAVQQTAGSGVLTLVDSITTGGFVIAAMAFTINWKLTLIALIPMPFMAALTSYYGKLLHARFHHAQEAFSHLNDKTQESISGIKVIKTFGQEAEDIEDFRKQSQEVVDQNMRVAKIDALFDPTIYIIVSISFFLSIVFGTKYILQNEMSIGDLVAFTTYLGLLIWPMLAFGWLFNIVERGRASYDRIQTLFHEKEDIADDPYAIQKKVEGDLTVHIQQFHYPNEETPTLQEIDFDLLKGQTLGIVGKTGAGKTTLIKLLLREFDGYKGSILFGENEIHALSKMSLREAIGYVPQDHFLFSTTVASNIAFATPGANKQTIEHAAHLAAIHDDILQFTNGYETIVGERGVSLSGGQKQRISIARALLLNPELLILDDSLSAVDAKTEERILQNMKQTRENKTTIITSHRLSAIAHAHQIIVLEKGKMIEKGTHDELMDKRGTYYEMYLLQQLEALVEQGGDEE